MSKEKKTYIAYPKFGFHVVDGHIVFGEPDLTQDDKDKISVLDLSPEGTKVKGVGLKNGHRYTLEQSE